MRRVLAKPRLILGEMCCLYGICAYLRHVLCKTRLIFPRINGPNCFVGVDLGKAFEIHQNLQGNTFFAAVVLKASRNELQAGDPICSLL